MPKKNWPTAKEIRTCKNIMKKSGKNYFFANWFFPKKVMEAVQVLYAFYRVPDDIVDIEHANNEEQALAALTKWESDWKQALQDNKHNNPVLSAAAKIHKLYHIPPKYSFAFLKAMKQDITKTRYQTMDELMDYMYGSAGVVGIMVTHIIGQKDRKVPDKETLKLAETLGYAMQLTNFYRDIHEDIVERNRIYIPQSSLKKYECDHKLIEANRYTKKWEAFMFDQISTCHKLYIQANKGIKNLNKKGQLPVLIASNLYRYYLKLIKDSQYKVHHTKYKIPFKTKVTIAFKTCFGSNIYN